MPLGEIGDPSREEARKTPKKVAIIGGGPTRTRAPFRDPTWEIWAFSSRRWRPPRVTRWFEIHAMTDLRQQLATHKPGRRSFSNYMRFMRRLDAPIYMRKQYKAVPNSVVFPVEALLERYGRVFTSTASFLVALAIMEEYDVIGMWGIDPRSKNYRRQRPAIRYFLSMAKREGIELKFPRGFSMRIPRNAKVRKTRILYAYDWRSPGAWWRARVRRRLRRRRMKRSRQ